MLFHRLIDSVHNFVSTLHWLKFKIHLIAKEKTDLSQRIERTIRLALADSSHKHR